MLLLLVFWTIDLPAAQQRKYPQAPLGISAQQADAILTELRAIRQALESLAKPQPVVADDQAVRLSDVTGYMLGRPDAPVTIVEFTDLQCPFCQRFSQTTFEQLKATYIDTGQVRFITRDFPLDNLHPHAQRAALAARCAGEQGKFWDMRFALLQNGAQINPSFIDATAERLALNTSAFRECLEGQRYREDIEKDVSTGRAIGVQGTPTFVIGPTAADALVGVRVVGAVTVSVLEARIREARDAAEGKKP